MIVNFYNYNQLLDKAFQHLLLTTGIDYKQYFGLQINVYGFDWNEINEGEKRGLNR